MYTANDIRNIALLGHGGDGKSALCESMLFTTKAITRLGKRADGTTVSDFDDEEKKRQYSLRPLSFPSSSPVARSMCWITPATSTSQQKSCSLCVSLTPA